MTTSGTGSWEPRPCDQDLTLSGPGWLIGLSDMPSILQTVVVGSDGRALRRSFERFAFAVTELVPSCVGVDVTLETGTADTAESPSGWKSAAGSRSAGRLVGARICDGDVIVGEVRCTLETRSSSRYDAELRAWLSAHADLLFANARLVDDAQSREKQLLRAADEREIIGLAKGILMARDNVSDIEASAMLRWRSRWAGQTLAEGARSVSALLL